MSAGLFGYFVGSFSVSLLFAAIWLIICKVAPPLRRKLAVAYGIAIVLALVPPLLAIGISGTSDTIINFAAALLCVSLLFWQYKRAKARRAVSIFDALIESLSSIGCNWTDETISSYAGGTSGAQPTREVIISELFRLELFMLMAACSSGSVQESRFAKSAPRIFVEVSEKWSKRLGIKLDGGAADFIRDYWEAAHSTGWGGGKRSPFDAVANVLADRLGIWEREGGRMTMERIIESTTIMAKSNLYSKTICEMAQLA